MNMPFAKIDIDHDDDDEKGMINDEPRIIQASLLAGEHNHAGCKMTECIQN